VTEVLVVGAGAAGLMAAIQAARQARASGLPASVTLVDSARSLGAKILVAGGGRCNVTHHAVDETAFSGSTPAAIRKVLRRFPVAATVAFFAELAVELKREGTGKLFPTTDRARTVLDALLGAAADAGVRVVHPWRVEAVRPLAEGFEVAGPEGTLQARRLVLATGGMSLPKSGSDGHGFALARALGHTTTQHFFPALVPLSLQRGCFPTRLSGVSCEARVEVRSSTGRLGLAMRGPLLCTHTGLSGPVVLDVSRHLAAARHEDPGAHLVVAWVPRVDPPQGKSLGAWLRGLLPDRLADALLAEARVDPSSRWERIPRDLRRAVESTLTGWRAPVTGDLGFAKAEVTAGGVPLSEVRLDTLESRVTPGLHLCGEILDVDGRIGGFNFQWAWASGYVAGYSSRSGGSTPEASR
jgi:predicted Rossmann fold flavoprotein